MDALKLLEKDHVEAKGLFKKLESAQGKEKETLFKELSKELEVHTKIEEVIFYPAIENFEETAELAAEAYEEHKVAKTLLKEMQALSVGEETWEAKLSVLQENVEHHIEEEETELFPKVKKVLDQPNLAEIGAQMDVAKQKEMQSA